MPKTNLDYLKEEISKLEDTSPFYEWIDGIESDISENENEIERLKDEVKEKEDELDGLLSEDDFETLTTQLGEFKYIMPDNLKMQDAVENFIAKLKNI